MDVHSSLAQDSKIDKIPFTKYVLRILERLLNRTFSGEIMPCLTIFVAARFKRPIHLNGQYEKNTANEAQVINECLSLMLYSKNLLR